MGLIDNPFDIPNLRCENGQCRGPYPHRLVPLRLQHSARLCGPVDGRGDRGGTRARSEGCVAGTARTGSHRGPAQIARGRRLLELRRSVRDLSDRHRAVAPGRGARRANRPDGASSYRRARASASPRIAASSPTWPLSSMSPWMQKGALSIRQVDTAIDCGFHVNPERIRSQIEGAAVMGLALAKHGADHLQGRAAAAKQLRRLRGGADRRGTARRADAYRASRLERAVQRCRRAWAAAVRAGAVQRHLRRHRQADTQPADRRPVEGLVPTIVEGRVTVHCHCEERSDEAISITYSHRRTRLLRRCASRNSSNVILRLVGSRCPMSGGPTVTGHQSPKPVRYLTGIIRCSYGLPGHMT